MRSDSHTRLTPAVADPEGSRPAYMPRLPWRFLALAGVLALIAGGAAALNARASADSLRRQVVGLYANRMGVHAKRHLALRPVLAALARRSVAGSPAGRAADPALLERLRSAPGLHARIAYDADPRAPLASLRRAGPALPSCLGAEAVALDAYLPRARALLVDPPLAAAAEDDGPRLRVMAHELAARLERDGELVREGAWARWALFAVERNADASRVDLFLWDLDDKRLLADAEVEGAGAVLTARITDAPGVPVADAESAAAVALDCSLAAALKARVGQQVPVVSAAAASLASARGAPGAG